MEETRKKKIITKDDVTRLFTHLSTDGTFQIEFPKLFCAKVIPKRVFTDKQIHKFYLIVGDSFTH